MPSLKATVASAPSTLINAANSSNQRSSPW
jgi:hypothetical protein